MRKRLGLALLAAMLIAAGAAAQAVDVPAIAIENGVDLGYNLNPAINNIGNGYRVAILIGVSERVQAGFHFITGDGVGFASYRFLGLEYAIAPRLGASVYLGQQTTALGGIGAGTATVGLGVNYALFSKILQGGLETSLKLRADYFMPTGGDEMNGLLRFGLAASIGL